MSVYCELGKSITLELIAFTLVFIPVFSPVFTLARLLFTPVFTLARLLFTRVFTIVRLAFTLPHIHILALARTFQDLFMMMFWRLISKLGN